MTGERAYSSGIREVEMSFTALADSPDVFEKVVTMPERTLTLRLGPGQTWPYRRGTPVVFDINGARFVGIVRYRRLGTLVCVGGFVG